MRALNLTALAALLAAPFAAAGVAVDIRPSEVTVYPQGASVLRKGSATLPAGPVSVVFEGLPSDAIEDSLRLSAEGPKGTRLYGIRMAEAFSAEAVLKRRKELESKIQALEDEKAALGDRVAARQAEIDILKALATQSATSTGQAKAGIAGLAGEVAVVGRRIAELNSASRKDAQAQRGMQEKLDALRGELGQIGNSSRRQRSATADLELPEAGEVSFSLGYHVNSAGWTPVYDLRLEGSKVAIAFSGDVRQQTGEDWDGVKLELSTARPAAFAEIPDPTQWWLDFPQPVYNAPKAYRSPMKRGVMGGQAAPSAVMKMDTQEPESEPVQQEMAETTDSGYAAVFTIRRPAQLPSDNASHRVAVAESSHPANILLVAVPRLDQAAFIQAEVSYAGKEPLLPGAAQLFREGEYVGRTTLTAVAPGESFKLGFGKDDQVKVKRSLVDDKTSPGKGFVFTTNKRRYHWRTTVTNFHSSSRAIEIREQLPRSRQKEIEVEALETAPKPLDEDPAQPGLLRWRLELKPKQEQNLIFRYEIRHPEGRPVAGME